MNRDQLVADLLSLSLPTKIFLGLYAALAIYLVLKFVLKLVVLVVKALLNVLGSVRSVVLTAIKPGKGAWKGTGVADETSPAAIKTRSKSAQKKGKVSKSRKGRTTTTVSSGAADSEDLVSTASTPQQPGVSLKSLIKSAAKQGRGGHSHGIDRHADSDLFICTLKGHSDSVTGIAFSSDGSALATACEDRQIRIFSIPRNNIYSDKAFSFKTFSLRHGVQDLTFGSSVQFLSVLTRGLANVPGLCLLDLSDKENIVSDSVEELFTSRNAMALCLRGSYTSGLSGGTPIMVAASEGPELRLHVVAKGLPLLGKIDTGGMKTYGIAVSESGRFLAAATFASDVKIYEVTTDRTGGFSGVVKVMDLKGHRKKISSVAFSPDETKAVTSSEDGTFMIWDINVRYKQQEDPKRLAHAGVPEAKKTFSKLAWGPGGHIAAVCGSNLYFLDARSGSVVDSIMNAHSKEITDLIWAPGTYGGPQGAVRVVVTSGADGRVRLWQAPWVLI